MKRGIRIFVWSVASAAAAAVFVLAGVTIGLYVTTPKTQEIPSQLAIRTSPPPSPTPAATPTPNAALASVTAPVNHSVPFTVQAPLAQWNDPTFQDACEEAVILMAMAWADEAQFASPQQVTTAIADLSEFERARYGEFRDRSAEDTAQMINDYFDYPHVQFRADITADDIIREVTAGNLVIVPANGRALGNPHFTPPGPERHMVVIRGWDPTTQQFITNDPGTRFGEGYRYSKTTLYNAIRDYETGYHVPITSIEKNMIVVSKL